MRALAQGRINEESFPYLRGMKFQLLTYLMLVTVLHLKGQVAVEQNEVDFIKSIRFKGEEYAGQFPLVRLNETFTLSFDDLLAQDNDYYYRIKYFNRDWTPSELFTNQYLGGYDNLRIDNFQSSFGTLQRYTHYTLTLPNERTQFKVSGNYMLEVYNADDELVFSRKFLVYEENVQVQAGTYPARDIAKFNSHQNIQFTVSPTGFNVRNPQTDLNVLLLQNDQWDTAFFAPPPQFNVGNSYVYRYDSLTQFEGGNEFLYFDTKDIRMATPNISYVDREEVFQHYLYLDVPREREPYTYFPDINGDFSINTFQGTNPAIEADYSIVYFSLAKQYGLNDEEIFIYGKFNNYALNDENKMIYNPSLEVYEGILFLKQGFHNYKYVTRLDGKLDKNKLSGSHSSTENNYLILVYHRAIGALYDALVGWGNVQSFELKN